VSLSRPCKLAQKGKFSTWLFALATNCYRSHLRRIPAPTLSLDKIAEPASPQDSEWENEQQERTVRQGVATLPEKYREAVILFYFFGMDVPAAPEAWGCRMVR
jgi:DNA-directed RNA polymerase specialized sigma24 family protein